MFYVIKLEAKGIAVKSWIFLWFFIKISFKRNCVQFLSTLKVILYSDLKKSEYIYVPICQMQIVLPDLFAHICSLYIISFHQKVISFIFSFSLLSFNMDTFMTWTVKTVWTAFPAPHLEFIIGPRLFFGLFYHQGSVSSNIIKNGYKICRSFDRFSYSNQ